MAKRKSSKDKTVSNFSRPITVGDVVTLKTGGPKMVVSSYSNGAFSGHVDVVWNKDGNILRASLSLATLKLA